MIACDSPICPVEWLTNNVLLMAIFATEYYRDIFNILTKNCTFMYSFRLLIQDLKPHMVGAFEDFGRWTASPGVGEFVNICN